MSRRNTLQNKKLRRLARSLRGPRQTSIDLTEYLRDRGFASSRKRAEAILLEGRVYVDSHPVGRLLVDDPLVKGEKKYIVSPLIDSKYRAALVVRDHGPS